MSKKFISSPAGSGITFASKLLRSSFLGVSVPATHEINKIKNDDKQIVILRNPYNTIASGAERWVTTSNHYPFIGNKHLVEPGDIKGIKNVITWEEHRYIEFFKDIDNVNNTKILTFEMLTLKPDEFVKQCKEYLEISCEITKILPLEIFKEMKYIEKLGNRMPREKAEVRKTIDELVLEMYPKETWEAWKIYSDLKEILEKTK
jgi:hypothetical protein